MHAREYLPPPQTATVRQSGTDRNLRMSQPWAPPIFPCGSAASMQFNCGQHAVFQPVFSAPASTSVCADTTSMRPCRDCGKLISKLTQHSRCTKCRPSVSKPRKKGGTASTDRACQVEPDVEQLATGSPEPFPGPVIINDTDWNLGR